MIESEVKVKVTQLCPTLCNPINYTIHGILPARILEWVAFPYSRGSSQPRDQTQVSHISGRSFITEPQGKPRKNYVICIYVFACLHKTCSRKTTFSVNFCYYFRYADDTTLMAESEEELKSLLRKVKAESEKLA